MLGLENLDWHRLDQGPHGTCSCSTSQAAGMEMAGISLRALQTEGNPVLSWSLYRLVSLHLAFSLLSKAGISSPSPARFSLCRMH